jgi:hypothetical protein
MNIEKNKEGRLHHGRNPFSHFSSQFGERDHHLYKMSEVNEEYVPSLTAEVISSSGSTVDLSAELDEINELLHIDVIENDLSKKAETRTLQYMQHETKRERPLLQHHQKRRKRKQRQNLSQNLRKLYQIQPTLRQLNLQVYLKSPSSQRRVLELSGITFKKLSMKRKTLSLCHAITS